jgi:hypothetical protein
MKKERRTDPRPLKTRRVVYNSRLSAFISVHSLLVFLPRFSFFIFPFAFFLLPCEAAVPVLKALEPRGAQQGQVFTLKLKGEGLAAGGELSTTLPGTVSRLAPSADLAVPDSELPWLVQLNEQAGVGLYPIRIRTEEGLSNVLLFSVGTFPEVVEKESLLVDQRQRELEKQRNDTLETAQPVAVPVTINGTLVGPDRDCYRFRAKAGERLVLEVEARRAGSAIDPVIRVLEGTGRELASNNDAVGLGVDARVEVTFPKSGEYYALVHDARYSEQEQNFYRLKIGAYRYAEGLFPLGWQHGGQLEVELFGGNLKTPVKVKPELGVGSGSQWVMVGLPGGASLPFQFALSDRPEVLEGVERGAESLSGDPSPGLQPPSPQRGEGEKHANLLSPRPVKGRGAGGEGASGTETHNQGGEGNLASADSGIQPLRPGTVINGRISRPGEVDRYQLEVAPGQHWNFEIEAATLGTSQLDPFLSLLDPTTNKSLALADLFDKDDPYKQLVETGKAIAQRLSFTVPKGFSSVVLAVEDLLGRGGPNYGYRLLAIQESGDFSLEVAEPEVNIPLNGTAAIQVRVKRQGYRGPIHLTIPNLPDDISMSGGNIPADANLTIGYRPGYITLTAKPEAKPRAFQLQIVGETVGYEPPIRRQAIAPGMITTVMGTDQKPFKAPWLGTGLPTALAKSNPLALEVPVRHFRLPQGSVIKLPWKLTRPVQMTTPVEVDLRLSYFLKDLVIVPKPGGPENPNEGLFQISAGLTTPAVTFDFVLDGMVKKHEPIVTSPAVTVEIVPLYRLKLLSEKVEVKRGAKTEITGRVEREPGFSGGIKLRVDGLPEHVRAAEIAVEGDQNDFSLALEADPEAKPGEFQVRIASTASIPEKNEKQEYSVPDLKAHLTIAAGTSTLQAAQTN